MAMPSPSYSQKWSLLVQDRSKVGVYG